MHNNSLLDTLMMAESIENVDSKDFVVIAKKDAAFRALQLINSDVKLEDVFSDDEAKFFKLMYTSGIVLFLTSTKADIKFAEGSGFIDHELADALSAIISSNNFSTEFSKVKKVVFDTLDEAAKKHDGESLRQLRSKFKLDKIFKERYGLYT